jgi:hypothetical protein
MECKFCHKSFASISSLNKHLKTAKYCLNSSSRKSIVYSCEICDGIFTTKENLKRHMSKCEFPPYFQKIIDEKDEEFHGLEQDFVELQLEVEHLRNEIIRLKVYEKEYYAVRDRPTTMHSNTNTTNNTGNTTSNKLKMVNTSTIEPFTTDLVQKRLKENEYTYDMFMLGDMGIKRFIMGMITKDDEKNYVTTDVSRSNFHRFKETKKWSPDAGAIFLTDVFNEMKPLVKEYWNEFNREADKAGSVEEHESFDIIRDRTKPIVLAIDGSSESKYRKELLGDVIKHIKPHVAV